MKMKKNIILYAIVLFFLFFLIIFYSDCLHGNLSVSRNVYYELIRFVKERGHLPKDENTFRLFIDDKYKNYLERFQFNYGICVTETSLKSFMFDYSHGRKEEVFMSNSNDPFVRLFTKKLSQNIYIYLIGYNQGKMLDK